MLSALPPAARKAQGLRGEGDCLSCHTTALRAGLRYPHPEEVGCAGCHLPHRKGGVSRLLADPLLVCTEPCHTSMGRSHPVGRGLLNPTSKRAQDLTCTSACHDPHGSDHPKILRTSARELCFSCHDME